MTTKAPFLSQRFGAYQHRDVPNEDEELTHVGPGTPCGEWLRRFWLPVVAAEELKDLPVAVRIMGEDLVVFRDKNGRVGLMELHCCHRGSSLEYGKIEDDGIRCCYHGWKFAVDGTILDTPGEPPESTFKERLCHGAYPINEYQGLIFAYMGPPDKMPEFPMYDTFFQPGLSTTHVRQDFWPCNWLQVKDNCMDPIHTQYLHTIEMGHGFSDAHKEAGTLDFMESPLGCVYMHSRRVGDNIFLHMNDFILPTLHQVATNSEEGNQVHGFYPPTTTSWLVPIDDTHCTTFHLMHRREDQPAPPRTFGQDGNRSTEERQRSPGDWDAQISQRPIAVHAMERLGATDRGVTLLRRLVREGVRAVQRGEDPKGIIRTPGQTTTTYANNTVVVAPPELPTREEEAKLLVETGRRLGMQYLDDPSSHNKQAK